MKTMRSGIKRKIIMTVQVTALALGLIGTTTAVLAEQKVEL